MTQLLHYNESFEQTLLEIIDATLSWLDSVVRETVYLYLEEEYKIRKEEIPNRLEEFLMALETLFGQGAKLVQIQMMKELYHKTHCTFEFDPLNIEETYAITKKDV